MVDVHLALFAVVKIFLGVCAFECVRVCDESPNKAWEFEQGRVQFEQLIVRTNLTNRQTTKGVACRSVLVAEGRAANQSLVRLRCVSAAFRVPLKHFRR